MRHKLILIKPSWLIFLVTIVGIVFFSSLGVWQLQRAEFKKQILLENEKRKNSAPINIQLPISDPTTLRFNRVHIQGKYISDKQFVLDNQTYQHKVGYNIFTPFMLESSNQVVLVDRGWVPIGNSRDVMPNVLVKTEKRSIIGTIYVPYGEPFHIGGIDNGESTWPRRVQYLDFNEMQERLQMNILPLTIRLDPDQSDGFVRQWPVFSFTPSRHLGYAVQWFALTLTVIIFFLYFHIKIKR